MNFLFFFNYLPSFRFFWRLFDRSGRFAIANAVRLPYIIGHLSNPDRITERDDMNVLLAGHGSIGRAFEAIWRERNEPGDLAVCDLRRGENCLDLIRDPARRWDLVVNLTGMMTEEILPVCLDRAVDYIDAAFEDETIEVPETEDPLLYYRHYLDLAATRPKGSRAMFGFGMNPGIIEHIYFSHKPAGRHIAIELEYDSAEKDGEVFCTWSPVSYFLESVRAAKIITLRSHPCKNFAPVLKDRLPIRLTADGQLRDFCVIPHEESFYVMKHSPDCEAFAFLYQAPLSCQRFMQSHIGRLTPEDVRAVPVLHDVRGQDSVGMLFYDYTDNLRWVRNRGGHEKIFRKFGCNATCWQTACGVFVACRLIKKLRPGEAVTMSDISVRFKSEIDAVLDELDFKIECTEHAVDPAEFREQVLSWLVPHLRDRL